MYSFTPEHDQDAFVQKNSYWKIWLYLEPKLYAYATWHRQQNDNINSVDYVKLLKQIDLKLLNHK